MAFTRGGAMPGFDPVPRVNLLPRSEIDRRERAALARRWVVGVIMAVVLVAVVSTGTFAVNMLASQRLTAENARTTELVGQLAELSPVSKTRTLQRELEAYRTEAMGADVAWRPVFAVIDRVIPGRGTITAWDLTTGALPGDAEPADVSGVTGTVTLESAVPMDIVTMARDLRRQDGVIAADAVDLTAAGAADENPTYTYQLSATLDQTVYTGLYAKKEK
jgi:hypothetical protein